MENNWYDNNSSNTGNNNGNQNQPYQYQPYYQPNAQKQTAPKRFSFGQLIACLLVVALISGCVGAGVLHLINKANDNQEALAAVQNKDDVVVETPDAQQDAAPAPAQNAQSTLEAPSVKPDGTASAGLTLSTGALSDGDPTVTMIQNCMASAVGITTKVSASNYYGYNSNQKKQGGDSDELEYGSGSGIILTTNGYIVTCEHVVSGGEKVYVCLQDGTEYAAQVVGKDAQTDIAVLKIDAENLPAATLGNSSSAVVGETVYAVGNPLGEFICSVSTGIISGLDRTLELDGLNLTLMQTDAAVNPGNSGGGLFNSKGELIGIVNAKTASVGVEGLGFAIPVDSVKSIITDLMDLGFVSGRPYLGVTLQDVYVRDESSGKSNDFFGGYFGYGYSTRTQVVTVEKGSAAEKAGIVVNDVIVSLDGKEVSGAAGLTSMLYEYKVGDAVTITVLRGTESKDLKVTLGERAS